MNVEYHTQTTKPKLRTYDKTDGWTTANFGTKLISLYLITSRVFWKSCKNRGGVAIWARYWVFRRHIFHSQLKFFMKNKSRHSVVSLGILDAV